MQRTVYHLIMRFVGSEFFIETEYERETYLQLLGKALRTSDWKCIAYAVMSNHIHLALIAGMSPRAAWMRDANSPFGEWINRRRQRIGSVFVKKSGMWAVHPDEIANVVAYIHNNPVRAGVASKASESSWTSHRAYLGTCKRPDWLRVEEGFALMGVGETAAFDELVNADALRPRNIRRRRGRPSKKKTTSG